MWANVGVVNVGVFFFAVIMSHTMSGIVRIVQPSRDWSAHYKTFKVLVQNLIDKTRDERFDIQNSMMTESDAFMNDQDHHFGFLMAVATRAKIHRYFDETLQSLKRLQIDGVTFRMNRLAKLVPLFVCQITKLTGIMKIPNAHQLKVWYSQMLQSLQSLTNRLVVLNRLTCQVTSM